MNEAVAVSRGRGCKPYFTTHLQGSTQHRSPEVSTQGVTDETKHTDSYGTYLVVTAAKERTIGGLHTDQVSFFGGAYYLGYGSGEDPWMETAKGVFATFS